MYAEEVYSRIKINDDVEDKFNQDEHDKYSKSKSQRRSNHSKRPLCSETSIILFMLVFFACSCFVLMFYAPDVIDSVSIKLEEYTIIIDTYLPVRDENSSLIFQTITREDEHVKVGNVKSKDELEKEAEDEAYRLLQQADDERMQIAHDAMEKVNAKILLAIQERERKIRQQRKEDARVSRTKLFDETIAKERKRLRESQSKSGRKRRPNAVFINGQEVILPEERPTPNNLRKDPHVHDEKNGGHLIEKKLLADNPLSMKQVDKSANEALHSVPDKENIIGVQSKRDLLTEKSNNNKGEKIDRESNGKLKFPLSDGLAVEGEGEGQEFKFAVPDAETIKLNSEELVEIDNGVSMIGISRDQKVAGKNVVFNDLSRKQEKDLTVEDVAVDETISNHAAEKEKEFLLGVVEVNYNPGENIKILENNHHNSNSNSLKDEDIIPVKVELPDDTNNKEEQKLSNDQQDILEKAVIPRSDDDTARRFSDNKINKDSTIVEVPYDSDIREDNANVEVEDKVLDEDNVHKDLAKGQGIIKQEIALPVELEVQNDNIVNMLTDLKDLNEADPP